MSLSGEAGRAWRLENKDRISDQRRVWRQKNKEKLNAFRNAYYFRKLKDTVVHKKQQHKWHLKRTYNLTLIEYHEMLQAQAGECAICGAQSKRLNVDHCHSSNVVRGLLCSLCNSTVGRLERPGWQKMAEKYLSNERK